MSRPRPAWLAAALRHHGLEAEIKPLRLLPAGTRRRARFSIARPRAQKAAVEIGFLGRASHRIVDLQNCAVLHPSLMALVAPLRQLAPQFFAAGESGAATATLSDSGVDLLLDLGAAPTLATHEALAEFARAQNLARLAWRVPGAAPAPIAQARAPGIAFGGVTVFLPDEVFLQASAESDAALTAEVLGTIGDAPKIIADLYAGIGTFSLPLAARARVHAVERDEAALGALAAAVARAGLGHRLTCERRDLDARPLSSDELARFDAAVFESAPAPAPGRRLRSPSLVCHGSSPSRATPPPSPATPARWWMAATASVRSSRSTVSCGPPTSSSSPVSTGLDRAAAPPICTLMAFMDPAPTPTLPRFAGEGERFAKTNPIPPSTAKRGRGEVGAALHRTNPIRSHQPRNEMFYVVPSRCLP